MMPPLLLEDYFLTSLHIEWVSLPSPTAEIKAIDCSFDYELANHKQDTKLRKMHFKATFCQMDAKRQKVGYSITCEVVGLFCLTGAAPKGKEDLLFRLNGVSQLYGAMRGIISSVTGSFACGRFVLPSIMPQEIVGQIEKRKVATSEKDEHSAEQTRNKA